MTIQVTTSTADSPAFSTSPVTLHDVVWSNSSTTAQTIVVRDAASATATATVFTLDALGEDHGYFHIHGGGLRLNTGLSADKSGGTKLTVAYDDRS